MDCSEEESTCETILINQDFIKIANQLKIEYLKIKNDLFNEIINELGQFYKREKDIGNQIFWVRGDS